MKINAFLLILPVFSFFTPKETRSQQSTLHGVITVQNSQFDNGKVEYIAFAEVDECSQPRKGHALSDAQGQWRMELVGIAEKHPLLLKVKKEGYQVVNSDALQAIASQATPVRLHMATNKYITDAKRRYYNTGYTEAEKNLNKKLNAKTNELINLQKQTNADQNKIKALQEETALLQSQYEQLDSFARDLADKYARINLDDAGTLYQNVFRLFQAGDLEGAMQLWRNANLSGQVNNILEEEKRIGELKRVASERDSVKNRRKEELMQNLLLKVDAHQLRFEWDSVGITLREIVRLDTSNLNNLGQYTYFLYTQKQFPAAIAFLEKALATSNTPERRGDLLIKLGSFYGKMNEYVQEEKSLLEGVGIYRRLAQEKPDVFSFHLTQALHQLIFCYYSKEKYNNQDLLIEQTYLELLGIYRKLAVQNPGIHLFDLATTLRLLGSIYTNNKQNTLAEKYYLEALDVYREMARQMPDLYLGTLADALSDVSKYYRDNNKAQKSEELSGEALDVCRLWAERASVLKKPYSLIFLGKFYLNNAQFAEAEKMLMQAIDLVRKNNFQDAWELPSLASSITDLGNDFARAGKAEQAEKACEESIRIFRKLAMENQAAFLDELARSLEALSRIHRKNKQFSQATAEQEESLGLYRKLADINPDVFMPELASNLYRFGIFNDQPLQAEKALEESSDIYRKLARQNPDVFLPELAKTLRSLSKVNNKEKTWLEALEVARRLAQEKDSEVFIEDLASCLFEIMRYYGEK
ncbi:MAG: tetratricopeptide repeat protein [Lewinellaceae bacterium]|nr:tetratricopeptide repeat protein [Lewinellaceae bacterium]